MLQVVGALCCLGTLPSVLLGVGRVEHLNLSQKSPKILKMASESFIHAFFKIVSRSFSQNFPLGAPVLRCAKYD